MRLSLRTRLLGESATMQVTRRVQELKSQGIDVIDLGTGEPDFPSTQAAIRGAEAALRSGLTRYTVASGSADLRRALARRYALRCDAPWQGDGDVVVTVGGKGALFHLALALLDHGDQVLVPSPCWVSFAAQAQLAGGEAVLVPMAAQGGFELRSGPLIEALSASTRAVIVNSPCNPTGAVMARAELVSLIEACARRDVLVISDETYDRYVYDGQEAASAAELARRFLDTVVVVGIVLEDLCDDRLAGRLRARSAAAHRGGHPAARSRAHPPGDLRDGRRPGRTRGGRRSGAPTYR